MIKETPAGLQRLVIDANKSIQDYAEKTQELLRVTGSLAAAVTREHSTFLSRLADIIEALELAEMNATAEQKEAFVFCLDMLRGLKNE